ncbi:MAG TPA: transcription elongation factor GreA [Dehalococcoidia bacterium]|nr:transcription elongation factor GreA [Dehalococcoidia bacterium]
MTLGEAVTAYAETVKGAARQAALAELNRFLRWYGPDKRISSMRGHDVALYGDAMGPATPETSKRAEQIRGLFVYLKKQGVLDQNLGSHLRLKKSSLRNRGTASSKAAADSVELTQDGIDALSRELETLMEQRIAVREDIKKAMMDKDFRENSPLDAAKDKQGHIEARIRDIEEMLKRAVVVDEAAATGRVRVGTSVRVVDVSNGQEKRYSIVGPTEANAAEGKISSVSPVGKALLDATEGDEVEVTVPSGMLKLRIESIGD